MGVVALLQTPSTVIILQQQAHRSIVASVQHVSVSSQQLLQSAAAGRGQPVTLPPLLPLLLLLLLLVMLTQVLLSVVGGRLSASARLVCGTGQTSVAASGCPGPTISCEAACIHAAGVSAACDSHACMVLYV